MVSGPGRLFAVLVLAGLPLVAAAQTQTQLKSELGREQRRFQLPPASKAQAPERYQPLAVPELPRRGRVMEEAPAKFVLRSLRVTGATVYDEASFRPFYAEFLGRETTLEELRVVSKRITKKYADDGYVISRAAAPEKVADAPGAVTIRVIEGYIERVEWPPGISRYRDFFSDYAAKITADRPLNVHTLEHYLDTSDLPGLSFKYRWKPLRPDEGAYILIVTVTEKPLDLMVRIDNRGTETVGHDQSFSQATFNNLFGQHEAITFAYANTLRLEELEYFAGKYRQVLSIEGLNFLFNGTYSAGRPGAEIRPLDYRYKSTNFQAGMSYALLRSLERNLTLTGLIFASESNSSVFGQPFTDDKLRGLRLLLDGDSVDSLKGNNQWNVTVSQGFKGFGSTETGSMFASISNGRADFTKVEGSANRTQPLANGFSVYLSVSSQYGFNPELSPEQCGYGGRDFGRAFDPSLVSGDRCWMAIGELRYDLAPKPVGGWPATQLFGFVDHGKAYFAHPLPGFPSSGAGTSAGGGFRFNWEHLKTDFVFAKALDPEHDRVWLFFFTVTLKN
jgi:hemolysin activation/secretion protein